MLMAGPVMSNGCPVVWLSMAGEECQYHFTYQDGLQGTFTSPGFPEKYPMQIKCYYLFDAVNNGGVQIKFDVFHLEEKEDADSS